MKNDLTIDGKPVDPNSVFPTKRLSAQELNKLVSEVSNDLKQREAEAIDDIARKLHKLG